MRQVLIGDDLNGFVDVIEIDEQQHRLRFQHGFANAFVRQQDGTEFIEHLIGNAVMEKIRFGSVHGASGSFMVHYHLMQDHMPDLSFCNGMSHK